MTSVVLFYFNLTLPNFTQLNFIDVTYKENISVFHEGCCSTSCVHTLRLKMASCEVDAKFAVEGEQHLQSLSASSGALQ